MRRTFISVIAVLAAVFSCLPKASYGQAMDPWVTQPEVDGQTLWGLSNIEPEFDVLSSGVHTIRCSGGATSINPDADITVAIFIYVQGSLIAFNSAWGYSPSVSVTGTVPYADYARTVECYLEAPFVWARAVGTIQPQCGDDRTNIIEEYRAGQVAWTPSCGDFGTSGGSAHFSWSELNRYPGSGHPPFGIVKQVLWSGLESTRSNYNRGGLVIDSGYRCPHGNAAVGGAWQSRHMWGDAADMHSADHLWNRAEWDLMQSAARNAGASYIEPYEQDPTHLHADWR